MPRAEPLQLKAAACQTIAVYQENHGDPLLVQVRIIIIILRMRRSVTDIYIYIYIYIYIPIARAYCAIMSLALRLSAII